MDELGDQGDVSALIERRNDEELADLMENLGGNCVETMAETFAGIDPGDIASIETRLLERHPLYNGKMDAKSYRQHD